MVCTLSYQMYKYEHGLTPAERRAEEVAAGEAVASLRDLRHTIRRRRRVRVRPDGGSAPRVEPLGGVRSNIC